MANTVLATLTGEANPNGKPKTKSKNQLRRLKQKQKKVNGTTVSFQYIVDNFKHLMRKHFYQISDTIDVERVKNEDVEIPLASSINSEYASEELDVKGSGFEQFAEVFARFQPPEEASVCSGPVPLESD